MTFGSLLGRRHLWGREPKRRRSPGHFVWHVAARAAACAALVAGLALGVDLATASMFGETSPIVPLTPMLPALLPAVVAAFALLIVVPRYFGLTLTSHIAILCVGVGVASLIVVLGILDGLDATFHRKYMDVFAQVEVLPPAGARDEIFASPEAVQRAVAGAGGVEAFAPQIVREAFLLPDRDITSARTAVQMIGLDPAQTRPVAGFVDRIVEGTGVPGSGEVVLGELLATSILGVRVGDPLWAITRVAVDAHGYPHFRMEELRVAGLFRTGIPDLDLATAYVDLDVARRIFVLPRNAVGRFLIRLPDPREAQAAAQALRAEITAAPVRVRSWDETNAEFFHALRLERMGTFVMLMMILIVAAFNIIGTLVMIVTGRTREIGILKTMGASDPMIRRLFLRSGFVIGLLGTALGLAAGLGACSALSRLRLEIPAMLYDLDRIPIVVEWPTVLVIIGCSMGVCLLASVLPAQTAARLDPVQALRHE